MHACQSRDSINHHVCCVGLNRYIRLMEECWARDPQERPSFCEIARRLKAMKHWFSACSQALSPISTKPSLQPQRQVSSSRTPVVPFAVGSVCAQPRQSLPVVSQRPLYGVAARPMEPASLQVLAEVGVGHFDGTTWLHY
jgi:hypothetical protein